MNSRRIEEIIVMFVNPRASLELAKCGPHGFKHLLITRKSNPAFGRYESITYPNGELSGFSANSFDFDTEFFFEQRRYTSSAGRV